MAKFENAPLPIFIHSLYRSGSTYLFNVFRRSHSGYFCYQEPEHEFLIHLNSTPDRLLEIDKDTSARLRHPDLDKPYFWEFHQVHRHLAGLFKKSFSFDDYFCRPDESLSMDQHAYFGALIKHAQGQAVLQFCRSAGRAAALRNSFEGLHLHLWREPRNQWWSFKVNNSFDPATQMIYNAKHLPPVLIDVRAQCGITTFHAETTEEEFTHFRSKPLNTKANYLSFYALWLYAFIETEKCADIDISIDRLSNDLEYRDLITTSLASFGATGLDFSDASAPITTFPPREQVFYENIEAIVEGIFLQHGYSHQSLRKIADTRQSLNKIFVHTIHTSNEAASRARTAALDTHDRFAEAAAHAAMEMANATSTRAELLTLSTELAAIKETFNARNALIEALENDKRDLTEHLRFAQSELSSARLRNEQQHTDHERLALRLEHSQIDLNKTSEMLADTQRMVRELQTEVQRLKQHNIRLTEQLNGECTRFTSLLDIQQKEIDQIRCDKRLLNEQLSELILRVPLVTQPALPSGTAIQTSDD
ncbi:hypothetical protein [Burkholderia cepacia]|uniref:Sulfotransferase family protein n=1 Tax=Burkholderia cepacia TaxID=292 RepID=A0A8I1AKY8_BURCE|nr:hypothetical protein [Burkholderia cepacia]MBA9895730.1 hypothetical protein [Burkholderia cepacia]MBA9942861.1 hypothetical protein [Burkholderia cepacia]MBA9979537.1 hypothetical protein [Burkholderia cepacia]MBA9998565.1 hypothetical protein [Burkholderia cepacia]MBB0005939.1 hypothetical protein [Burkholderia cepacia]